VYSKVTGSDLGSTVMTATSGGGMPAPGWPPLPPLSGAPAGPQPAATTVAARIINVERIFLSASWEEGLKRRSGEF
jgi:hypothetical protein